MVYNWWFDLALHLSNTMVRPSALLSKTRSWLNFKALEKLGSEDWTWDNLVPYFKKVRRNWHGYVLARDHLHLQSETLKYKEEYARKHGYNFNADFHGTSGPLQKRIPAFFNPATEPWIEGVKAQGIRFNPDPVSRGTWWISNDELSFFLHSPLEISLVSGVTWLLWTIIRSGAQPEVWVRDLLWKRADVWLISMLGLLWTEPVSS